RIAQIRRDAGDASDLDVELATVNAGQQTNLAVIDSVAVVAALLDLQAVVGMSPTELGLSLADSLTPPPNDGTGAAAGQPLNVAAGEDALAAATFTRPCSRP